MTREEVKAWWAKIEQAGAAAEAAAITIEAAAGTIESEHGLWRIRDEQREALVTRLEAAAEKMLDAAVRNEEAASRIAYAMRER